MTTLKTTSACLTALKESGFNFFTGVADSTLASLIEDLERDPVGYIPAVREDQAVGLSAGAYLAGKWPVILMQNSGIGYCLNALTSLNLIYKIPTLLIIGYRGYKAKDAPEHLVMGQHCEALLQQVGIGVSVPAEEELPGAIAQANDFLRRERIPFAIFIRPGVLSS